KRILGLAYESLVPVRVLVLAHGLWAGGDLQRCRVRRSESTRLAMVSTLTQLLGPYLTRLFAELDCLHVVRRAYLGRAPYWHQERRVGVPFALLHNRPQ